MSFVFLFLEGKTHFKGTVTYIDKYKVMYFRKGTSSEASQRRSPRRNREIQARAGTTV